MTTKKIGRCPICKSPADVLSEPTLDRYTINCLRCGKYLISGTAYATVKFNNNQIAAISGWLRENTVTEVLYDKLESLKKLEMPTVGEKATKLLKYIAIVQPNPGIYVKIDFQVISNSTINNDCQNISEVDYNAMRIALPFLSTAWAMDHVELHYLIYDYLINEKKILVGRKGSYNYKITPKGWAFLDSLRYKNVDSQIAFIAMWFDESVDDLYKSIEKSILATGYEPKRVDRHEHVNRIDDEIISLIRQSKFVVADFTGQRGGVYFESGFGHGLNIPVIWTCMEKDFENVHFDTNHYNFLLWNKDNLLEFEKKLKNRIISVIGKGNYNSE